MTVVVIRTLATERAVEALRAAVGLTLRGEPVAVVPLAPLADDPRIARALGTLRALGHDTAAPLSVLGRARVVEVWT
jgi:hypothetical protein